MNFSPINLIEENDFQNAWAKACKFIMNKKHEFVFGYDKKRAYDSCQLIALTGHAIEQIVNRETHPQYMFGGRRLGEYCKEFTPGYLDTYNRLSPGERFDYLYYDRLVNPINQLDIMRLDLKWQVENECSSNQCQAITWVPEVDVRLNSTPCLQRISVRYIGNNTVDVRYDWRSRDITAWQANVVAITYMINRDVVEPNDCSIGRIIDFSDSLHCYHYNWDEIEGVKLMQVSPMDR